MVAVLHIVISDILYVCAIDANVNFQAATGRFFESTGYTPLVPDESWDCAIPTQHNVLAGDENISTDKAGTVRLS